ncbi:MAG: hypothetical protein IKL85_00815 [Lentisphaeria bacterium]|nr:hypothetical protein [Lentisphaeria bacterium]
MKKLTFWEKIDGVFGIGTFLLLLLLDLPFLLVPLMLIRYDNDRKDGIALHERASDRLINKFIRPEIETKYKTKAFRVKSRFNNAAIRIETDGAGQYAGITEDILRLAREPDIPAKQTPEERGTVQDLRKSYILEFDHTSEDRGVTVFCANGHGHPFYSTPWHTSEFWPEKNVK